MNPPLDSLELLREIYVFIGMKHKNLRPWGNALDHWQKQVETLTDWNHYREVKNWEKRSE
jgi:hypothetical protein